ncbi:hypothetical protein CEXT_753371 [Caerostris extrusa]|uniref:Uncharacterized protein n=1 Tax=Caerostris extrusa TaxID=172846 RepID=A0AAV4TG01_CAEEX|nr:hypothetical protein CEXT_753371 [Caerostris extrusa]
MRGDGRYCFSPHTIDRIVIKTRHGALTEGIKNAQPPSMSGVRVRVGIMEIDLQMSHIFTCPHIYIFTFHIYLPGWDPLRDRQRVGKLPDFNNGKKVTLPDVASSKGPSAGVTRRTSFKKEEIFTPFKREESSLKI